MSARFSVGDRVRIDDRLETRHHRVPAYVKGREGIVERSCRLEGQPELLAYKDDGEPKQTLYRVRLPQRSLWPDYQGPEHDALEIEIFEHWLSPA